MTPGLEMFALVTTGWEKSRRLVNKDIFSFRVEDSTQSEFQLVNKNLHEIRYYCTTDSLVHPSVLK